MPKNKETLITDNMLFEYGYIGLNEIQKFLEHIGSWLATKKCNLNGTETTFAEFLDIVCQENDIEPIFILALIQKEQSAVEKKIAPAQKIQDKIVGMGCPESGGQNSTYRGFENQILSAAKQFRRYEKWDQIVNWEKTLIHLYDDNATLTKYGMSIDVLKASSKAEAMAFLYNPRIEGVTNHSIIWQRYFKICSELNLIEE